MKTKPRFVTLYGLNTAKYRIAIILDRYAPIIIPVRWILKVSTKANAKPIFQSSSNYARRCDCLRLLKHIHYDKSDIYIVIELTKKETEMFDEYEKTSSFNKNYNRVKICDFFDKFKKYLPQSS